MQRMKGQQTFPLDFRWGTASSSHQVEGNNCNNQWSRYEQQPGAIAQGHRSGIACNWWENAEADFDRMAALGLNSHRLSLEWSRIEPRPARSTGVPYNATVPYSKHCTNALLNLGWLSTTLPIHCG